MKKYKFKLDALHRLRQWEEDEAQRNLGLANKTLEEHREELHKIQNEKKQLISQKDFDELDAARQMLIHHYLLYLNDKERAKFEKIAQCEKVVDNQQEKLKVAIQERKKLDRAKEKSLWSYSKDSRKEENKVLDELPKTVQSS